MMNLTNNPSSFFESSPNVHSDHFDELIEKVTSETTNKANQPNKEDAVLALNNTNTTIQGESTPLLSNDKGSSFAEGLLSSKKSVKETTDHTLNYVINSIRADLDQRKANGKDEFTGVSSTADLDLKKANSEDQTTGFISQSLKKDAADEKQYRCHICDMQFARHSSLTWHIQSHEVVQNMRGRRTDHDDLLLAEQHNQSLSKFPAADFLPSENGMFICEFCDKEFISAKGLRVHIAHAHKFEVPIDPDYDDEEGTLFPCDLCDKEFVSLKAMKVHISHMHTRVESEIPNESGLFGCGICNKQFETSRAKNVHVALMHKATSAVNSLPSTSSFENIIPIKEVQFCCEFCHKSFKSSMARKVHTAHMHKFAPKPESSVKPLEDICTLEDSIKDKNCVVLCEFCGKEFDSIKAKRIHISHKHKFTAESSGSSEFPLEDPVQDENDLFSCDFCGKEFDSVRAKRIHIAHMHKFTNDNIDSSNGASTLEDSMLDEGLNCESCSKKFDSLRAKHIHIAHKHKFTTKSNDSGEFLLEDPAQDENDPFSCDFCGKEFDSVKAKRIHIAHMHKFTNGNINASSSASILEDSMLDEKLICEFCDKEFDSLRAKHIHIAHKHKFEALVKSMLNEEINFSTCKICKKEFASVKAMKIHIKHMHRADLNCEICDQKFESSKAKKIHKWHKHKFTIDCDISTSANENCLFNCEICNKEFDSLKAKRCHLSHMHKFITEVKSTKDDSIKSTSDDKNQFTCEFCGRKFETSKSLKIHNYHMHSFTNGLLNCEICHTKFGSMKNKKIHMAHAHTDPNDDIKIAVNKVRSKELVSSKKAVFACHLCDRTFSCKKGLSRHVPYHNIKKSTLKEESTGTTNDTNSTSANNIFKVSVEGNNPPQLEQENKEQCEQTSSNKNDRDTCDQSQHTKLDGKLHINNWECMFCKCSFETVSAMTDHIVNEHKNETSFCCIFCKNTFLGADMYYSHMLGVCGQGQKFHSAYSFICDMCPKTFSHPKSLQRHWRCDHGRENHQIMKNCAPEELELQDQKELFKCIVCSRSFTNIKGYAGHMKAHKMLGPGKPLKKFKCPYCPNSYTNIKSRSAHLKVHIHQHRSIDHSFAGTSTDKTSTLTNEVSNPTQINVSQKEPEIQIPNNPDSKISETNLSYFPSEMIRSHATGISSNDSKKDAVLESGGLVFRCQQCPKSFNKQKALSNHLRTHEFKCELCPKAFLSFKALKCHKRMHKRLEGGKPEEINVEAKKQVTDANASINEKNYDNVTRMESVKVALQGQEFKCPHCPRIFPNLKGVATHSRYHSNDELVTSSLPEISTPLSTNAAEELKCSVSSNSTAGQKASVNQAEFKCKYCGHLYFNIKALAGHLKAHKHMSTAKHDDLDVEEITATSFSCQFCDRTFSSHRGFARHVWVHSGESTISNDNNQTNEESEAEKAFECQYCDMKFTTGRSLSGHMRHHKFPDACSSIHIDTDGNDVDLNEEDQFICDTCDEAFECREDLSEHVRNHTSDPLLSTEGPQAQTIISPWLQTSRNGYMMCHVCNRLFSSQSALKTHMFKKHRWGQRKNIMVSVSPKKTSTLVSSAQNNTESSICGHKRSPSPSSVIDVENESIEDPINICKTAHKRARTFSEGFKTLPSANSTLMFNLRNNGEIYTPNHPTLAAEFREMHLECMYCRKHFSEKQTWMDHVHTHLESAEYSNADLENYVDTQSHDHFVMEDQDGNEERFIFQQYNTGDGYHCNECDEAFRDKLQMLIHLSYHMESKLPNGEQKSLLIKADSALLAPYKCNFCDQRFINKKYRNLHLCKCHRNDIQQCEICQKLFICKETLKQHYEQHEQDRRYQCEYCGKCFRSKLILKRHTNLYCELKGTTGTGPAVQSYSSIAIKEEQTEMEHDFEDGELENGRGTSAEDGQFEIDSLDQKFKTEDLDIGSFICDCCNKRFASEMDMQTHENQPQKLLFCCGLCNLYFIDTKNAEVHSKMHIVEQESDLDLDG